MRNPIEEVAATYVNLKRTGRNLVGLCPFHNEKTPSFTVYPDSDSFFCFGCSTGGDTITFIKQIENLDYIEAVRFLAQRAGLTVPEGTVDDSMTKLRRRVMEANVEAARYYHKILYSEKGAKALQYLYDRKLSDATIKRFGLGYAPDAWGALIKELGTKGFKPGELVAANLASQSRTGGYIDIFRNRIMFPIIDLRGNVIAFGGRVLEAKANRKYVNTSDTVVYKKSQNVFALNLAKNEKGEELILAEGYMDVISLHQAGFRTAIASLGTAFTSEQAQLISRYAKRVVVSYDADEAGRLATSKAIPLLKKAGLAVRVLTIPDGKDPDDYIKAHGAVRFKNLLEQTPNDMEYRLSLLRSQHNNCATDTDRIAFLKEATELLAALSSAIERDVYASRLSQELSIEKAAILEQLKLVQRRRGRSEQREEMRKLSRPNAGVRDEVNPERALNLRAASAEEALLAYILRNPDKVKGLSEKIRAEDMVTAFNRRVYEVILTRFNEKRDFSPTSLSSEFDTAQMGRIALILAKYAEASDDLKEAAAYIDIIKQEREKLSLRKEPEMGEADLSAYLDRLRERKQ